MSGNGQNQPGTIAWVDLTVPNTDQVSEFYQEVVGDLSR